MDKELKKEEPAMRKKLKDEKDVPTVVEKEHYSKPTLFIYGSVKELTNGGSNYTAEKGTNDPLRIRS